MAMASVLVVFACAQHVVQAEEAQLPQKDFQKETPPAFLSVSDEVTSCKTDDVCEQICETDFMVYPLGEKCYKYCHEDIHYIWDVFDSYCGEGDRQAGDLDQHHFCADLCYDGFYCGDSTCGPCEDKCVESFGLVQQIFDNCADCDHIGGDDDDYKTTTTTTTFDKCASDDADKCYDMECWCKEVCDIVQCPHCEELCFQNQDKVMMTFDRYCECGFCDAPDGDDAGLLQFRLHSAASDESMCSCRSEHQYCIDICHDLGYRGEGLHRCTDDCYSSGKLGGLLEGYCHECHGEYYETTTEPDTTTTTSKAYKTTTPEYYKSTTPAPTTAPYYESTTPEYYKPTTEYYETTTPEYYESTTPQYYDTTEPYYDTTKPSHYYGANVPYYWKIKAAKAKIYAAKKYYYAKGKAEAFKYTHPDYFGKYPKKEIPYYWKIKAAKAKGYAKKAEYEAKAKAAYFKYRHPEVWGYDYNKYKK
ncbi:POLR2A [Symbiodinium natans]|uniref:POLR2A protein n=1 Tax=Symbiodinium natans TaxID=878477 RepID=A0A812SAX5_9DINO|nr:POLR2A [Symbiodinium natans]